MTQGLVNQSLSGLQAGSVEVSLLVQSSKKLFYRSLRGEFVWVVKGLQMQAEDLLNLDSDILIGSIFWMNSLQGLFSKKTYLRQPILEGQYSIANMFYIQSNKTLFVIAHQIALIHCLWSFCNASPMFILSLFLYASSENFSRQMSNYNYRQQQPRQGFNSSGYANNYPQQNYYYNNQSFNQSNGNLASQNKYNLNASFSQGYYNQNYSQSYNNYNYYQKPQYNQNYEYQRNNYYPGSNKKLNESVSYQPIIHPNESFNNSFASKVGFNGAAEVGRFGGKKKKQREELDSSKISSTQQKKPPGPKVKTPSVKEQSSNQFYFPVHTETTNYVQCPFNSEHIMQPDRLMTHINKCKQKSPNAKYFSVCPYDPCHYFSQKQIQAHILVCDKRSLFVVDQFDTNLLNSSTANSIPQSSDNQLLETSTKTPTSSLSELKKKEYEDFILSDV